MTFNEIEKEFEELFVKKVMLIDEPDKLAYEEMKYQVEPEAIKSFLKQSFIKYLKDEVERLEKIKLFTPTCGYESEEEKGFQKGIQAQEKLFISDQITHLQAQLKELESIKN